MHTHTLTHTHTCRHSLSLTHTHTCTHTHARTHASTHARAHTHTQAHTHTHTHAHTHTRPPACLQNLSGRDQGMQRQNSLIKQPPLASTGSYLPLQMTALYQMGGGLSRASMLQSPFAPAATDTIAKEGNTATSSPPTLSRSNLMARTSLPLACVTQVGGLFHTPFGGHIVFYVHFIPSLWTVDGMGFHLMAFSTECLNAF